MSNNNSINYNEIIQELVSAWYEYVSFDHHKDRDCHWYIETITDYCYDGEIKTDYVVKHYGYIADSHQHDNYQTLEDAQKCLIRTIIGEMSNRVHIESDEDPTQKEYAKTKLKELVNKYNHIDYLD